MTSLTPALKWSEPAAPNDEIRYDHVIAHTPFGRILITWKSWKPHSPYTIDEQPGVNPQAYAAHSTLQKAKQEATNCYWERLQIALGVDVVPGGSEKNSEAVVAQVVSDPQAERSVAAPSGHSVTVFQPLSMPPVQLHYTGDPKYGILNGRLVNIATLQPIEEEIFIFRAKDKHLPAVLQFYLTLLANGVHRFAVANRLQSISQWQQTHFYLLKEPDTQVTG